ncbi:ATP-grasp domain-containing protein [Actinosynnema sp. CS-041913]|uniref:ATP-grasp domain-containing protein n=1 Tax=Actinosynnema sp. CS-041913 TaxID=3239917 RepID=UPI003D8FFFA2
MAPRKHVLVVGGPSTILPKLAALGLRHSMVQLPELVRPEQYAAAERYGVLDYRVEAELAAVSRAWHAVDPFDAVVSFTEYGLEPASRTAADLGVAGDNLAAVRATRDKTTTRALLDRAGLSPVRYRVCADVAEASAFLREVGGPVVLKPRDRGLSEGVYLVADESDLARRWALTTEVESGAVLVEEFLDGPEFSVESISFDGAHEIAMITEKVTTPLPRFVELGHQVPARLDESTRADVVGLVTRFLDLIGQTTGPAHTELRLTRTGPRLIESQTRIGGDQVWELCELVSGVDLMAENIAHLVGVPRPGRAPVASAAAIRFFAHENVLVRDVRDVAAAGTAPGVVRVECTLAAGQELGPLLSSASRQGYVLATGGTVQEAVAAAERARDLVRVKTEPLTA